MTDEQRQAIRDVADVNVARRAVGDRLNWAFTRVPIANDVVDELYGALDKLERIEKEAVDDLCRVLR